MDPLPKAVAEEALRHCNLWNRRDTKGRKEVRGTLRNGTGVIATASLPALHPSGFAPRIDTYQVLAVRQTVSELVLIVSLGDQGGAHAFRFLRPAAGRYKLMAHHTVLGE